MNYLTSNRWEKLIHKDNKILGKQSLYNLINGRYSVIVLRNVLSEELLKNVKNNILNFISKLETTKYSNGSLTTFGSYLVKHLKNLPEYFEKAGETDILFDPNNDLRNIVRNHLCHIFSVRELTVAKENDKSYSPAVLRIHSNGVSNPLHNDNIIRDAIDTDLILKKLTYQLSCIVCIQECDFGGELKHYFKRWDKSDEIHKIKNNGLGYAYDVVKDAMLCTLKPKTGDIYIINPTYYHEIRKVIGKDRITMGFFFGFFEHNLERGVVWS